MARTDVWPTIQRIRRQLHSGFRYESLVLAGAINDTVTTLSFTSTPPSKLTVGSTVCVDLEVMRVTAVNESGQSATVIRGHAGSTAAAHLLDAEVEINPRWEPLTIYDAMVAEIQSWAPSLFATLVQSTAVVDGQNTVELEAGLIGNYGVLGITFNDGTTDAPSRRVRFRQIGQAAPTIRLVDPLPAGTVEILAAIDFDVSALAATDDLVADVGLRTSMVDLLELGTKVRLTPDAEHQRSGRLVQDQTRRAEETPVGSYVNHANHQMGMYRMRKEEEIKKLRALYPMEMG